MNILKRIVKFCGWCLLGLVCGAIALCAAAVSLAGIGHMDWNCEGRPDRWLRAAVVTSVAFAMMFLMSAGGVGCLAKLIDAIDPMPYSVVSLESFRARLWRFARMGPVVLVGFLASGAAVFSFFICKLAWGMPNLLPGSVLTPEGMLFGFGLGGVSLFLSAAVVAWCVGAFDELTDPPPAEISFEFDPD